MTAEDKVEFKQQSLSYGPSVGRILLYGIVAAIASIGGEAVGYSLIQHPYWLGLGAVACASFELFLTTRRR